MKRKQEADYGDFGKQRRIPRRRWKVHSNEQFNIAMCPFALLWSEDNYLSVLLHAELIVYKVCGKPYDANGLVSSQCYRFSLEAKGDSEDFLDEDAEYIQKKYSLDILKNEDSFMKQLRRLRTDPSCRWGQKSEIGKQKFCPVHFLQQGWSPLNTIKSKRRSDSTCIIALLRSDGRILLCTIPSNPINFTIKAFKYIDQIFVKKSLINGKSEDTKMTLFDTEPCCLEWRPKRLCFKPNDFSVLAVGGKSYGGRITFFAIEPDGSVKSLGAFDPKIPQVAWTTALAWHLSEEISKGQSHSDYLIAGHEQECVSIWEAIYCKKDEYMITVPFKRLTVSTGFAISKLLCSDWNSIVAVSGNAIIVWEEAFGEADSSPRQILADNTISGLVVGTATLGRFILAVDIAGRFWCWQNDLHPLVKDQIVLDCPESLADNWKKADASCLTFDASTTCFPTYGVAISPNSSMIITFHVQLNPKHVELRRIKRHYPVLTGLPLAITLKEMVNNASKKAKETGFLYPFDIAWRLEVTLSKYEQSSCKYLEEIKHFIENCNYHSDDQNISRIISCLALMDLSWPKQQSSESIERALHRFSVSTRRAAQQSHVKLCLESMKLTSNDNEMTSILLMGDLGLNWYITNSFPDADSKKQWKELLKRTYRRCKRIVPLSDWTISDLSAVHFPLREVSFFSPDNNLDSRINYDPEANAFGLKGVTETGFSFARCARSMLCLESYDSIFCSICDQTVDPEKCVAISWISDKVEKCCFCGVRMQATSQVSVVLNAASQRASTQPVSDKLGLREEKRTKKS